VRTKKFEKPKKKNFTILKIRKKSSNKPFQMPLITRKNYFQKNVVFPAKKGQKNKILKKAPNKSLN